MSASRSPAACWRGATRPGLRFFSRITAALETRGPDQEGRAGRVARFGEAMLFDANNADGLPTAEVRQFREVCATLDDFNADVARYESELRPKLRHTVGETRRSGRGAGAPLSPSLIFTARLRDTAAALARIADAKMNRYQMGLFAVMFVAFAAFHLYLHGQEEPGERVSHCAFELWVFLAGIAAAGALVVNVW